MREIYTNHSLRASGATKLFQKEVPEKVIQEITGHRSLKALRKYEKVSSVQKIAASNILTGASKENFNAEVKRLNTNVSSSSPPLFTTAPLPELRVSSSSIRPLVFNPVINSNGSGPINFNFNMGGCSTTPSVSLPPDELLLILDIEEFLKDTGSL